MEATETKQHASIALDNIGARSEDHASALAPSSLKYLPPEVYQVFPQKSMMTRLKTAVRCQTLRATAATVIQKQVRQFLKIELKEEVIESQEEL